MAAKRVNTNLFAFDAGQEPSIEQEADPAQATVPLAAEIPNGPRHAVGFYFTQDTIDALDAATVNLRRGAKNRGAVTKSALVELALRAALQDVERNGADSMLARLLAS